MIPWARPKLEKSDLTHLNRAFKSNWISGGQYINKLENILKKILKAKNVLVTSSGTAAIHLAYLAIGLKKGNEIIVPGYGYLAAANMAKLLNLRIVFADVDPNSFCVTEKNIVLLTCVAIIIEKIENKVSFISYNIPLML